MFSLLILGKNNTEKKEYGGDEGWVFIEENGYRLVIDAILEMQQGTADDDEEEDEKDNNVMMMEVTHFTSSSSFYVPPF